MIIVRDWIPIIPEEEKHIAYVGENSSEYRVFFLTGTHWQQYRDWSFYLDMAFDLSSVTTRESRQVVSTQENTTENVTEAQVQTNATGKKETYTVEDVAVDATYHSDVVYLSKRVLEDGIELTWEVWGQQTQLPGKLTATLRAKSPLDAVKKSALMVFEVDPAVVATPAAVVPRSTFEQMLDEMSTFCEIGYDQVQEATAQAKTATEAAWDAEEDALAASGSAEEAQAYSSIAIDARNTAVNAAEAARQAEASAQEAAAAAITADQEAAAAATAAQTAAQTVTTHAADVSQMKDDVETAAQAAQAAAVAAETAAATLVVDDALSGESTNPVQNKVVHASFGGVQNRFNTIANAMVRYDIAQDLTDEQKAQARENIGAGEPIIVDDALSDTSTNPVQNKVVNQRLFEIATGIDSTFVKWNEVDTELSTTSTRPVQNKAVKYAINTIHNELDSGLVPRIEALEQRGPVTVIVDTELDVTSGNPIANRAVAGAVSVWDSRVTELETQVGDIDTALDGIIALQQSLIGGDGV